MERKTFASWLRWPPAPQKSPRRSLFSVPQKLSTVCTTRFRHKPSNAAFTKGKPGRHSAKSDGPATLRRGHEAEASHLSVQPTPPRAASFSLLPTAAPLKLSESLCAFWTHLNLSQSPLPPLLQRPAAPRRSSANAARLPPRPGRSVSVHPAVAPRERLPTANLSSSRVATSCLHVVPSLRSKKTRKDFLPAMDASAQRQGPCRARRVR